MVKGGRGRAASGEGRGEGGSFEGGNFERCFIFFCRFVLTTGKNFEVAFSFTCSNLAILPANVLI